MVDNTYDALQLENQLCFPLYACSRELIKRCRPALDALELTYTQYIVLMVIWSEDTVSVRDLGRRLYLDSGTLTPVLKHLEQKGYITRRRSREDERVLMVTITDKGLQKRDEAQHVPAEMAQAVPLSPEEAETLHQLLFKLLQSEKA